MTLDLLIVDETTTAPTDNGDDGLTHLFCCDPNVAFCGADISDSTLVEETLADDLDCVVCQDLADLVCEGCS